ncbi:MAG: hypothetical protein AUH86_03730 [Acidobacteria bacterium 13_1_40CM_4_58_4]|nr:MAG: hypothetical protein AUH86_03730 [Acidobacteria bacterium 13_1_40CM_4_58_4]
MARIAPFRALRYDPGRVALPQVVTQPYDKITPEMQDRYYATSPYNLVRIILGKQQPTDHAEENPYTRAAGFFRDWRRQGIFLQETEPSLYLYLQHFTVPGSGTEMERRGFIALGQLEDYADAIVFRHEQNLASELLRATRAHFGQLFMLYSDPAFEIDSVLAPGSDPDLETRDEYGVLHRVWKIADPSLIDLVRGKMRDKKLIIADGHHRYETALNYRDERRTTVASASVGGIPREHSSENVLPRPSEPENAPYELAMMTFINMDSPGLVILPTHRVVHGLASFSADALHDGARAYFSVEEVDPTIDAVRANAILRQAGHMGTALLAVTADRAFLLDRPQAIGAKTFAGLSLRQESLDVVQLHKCLLEGVLGISEQAIRDQQNISYARDTGEALAQVRRGAANVAFLMNPVRMQQVRDIAFAGEVLPQKSTDFYPKLLSGLTIYALE